MKPSPSLSEGSSTREEFDKKLSGRVHQAIDEGKDPDYVKMVRYARQATDDVFRDERVRLNAFLIEATKRKMEIVKGMMTGLEAIQQRLFDPAVIKSTNVRELVTTFCAVSDKVLAVLSTIEGTRESLNKMDEVLGGMSQARPIGSAIDPSDNPLNPNSRRRLQQAYQILFQVAQSQEFLLEAARQKPIEVPVLPVEPSGELTEGNGNGSSQ